MRLIDADQFEVIGYKVPEGYDPDSFCAGVEFLAEKIDEAPTIESGRKKGKWKKDNSCPFCGFEPWYEGDIHSLSFCPNCGADMREDT